MLLLIDNYDSFTFNLYQYLAELGADVEVHRNDQISVEDCLAMRPGPHRDLAGPVHALDEAGISVDLIRRRPARCRCSASAWATRASAQAFGGEVRLRGRDHARQDLDDHARRQGRVRGPAQPVRGDSVSFAGDRAGDRCPRCSR